MSSSSKTEKACQRDRLLTTFVVIVSCCLLACGNSLCRLFDGVAAKEVVYEWDLTPVIGDAFSPDCMNTKEERRSLFLAEKMFPGPTIEADEGDTIIIRVNNLSPTTSASIHFHGIHQIGTPYDDGASFITQCGLPPEQSQEYVFTAYPPGTHYWHDHASYNLADGMSGPMIIHPKNPDPFQYDEERILYLQDWYIETGNQQYDGLNSWPFIFVGSPNSLLINGKGIAPECQVNGTNFNNSLLCLPSCSNSTTSLLSTIHVSSGKTYRLRIINAGQLMMVNLAIAGHTMTVVQAEGTNLEPLPVSSLDIAPGQRYDVLLVANASSPGSFMIETTPRERNIGAVTGRAILHYAEASEITEPVFPPSHPVWNDTEFGITQDTSLKTLNASSYPSYNALKVNNSEVTRYILVGTQNQYIVNGTPQLLRWAMNNISTMHGPSPLIGKAYNTARNLGWPSTIEGTVDVPLTPPVVWDYTQNVTIEGGPGAPLGTMQESIVKFKAGQVVEFVLQNARALNGAAEFHPWHIHGHSFWIVGQGRGNYNPDVDIATYNLDNPVLRDTVVLQSLSWVALRFVTDNPGAWFFHCHIMSHHAMGMGLTMLVQPDKLDSLPPTIQTCSDQQLEEVKAGNSTSGTSSTGNTTSSSSTIVRPITSAFNIVTIGIMMISIATSSLVF